MRIICWNCRGVGNPQAVNAMVDIVQYYKPSILFLMETKANGVRMEQIKSLLRFSHCFSVDSVICFCHAGQYIQKCQSLFLYQSVI